MSERKINGKPIAEVMGDLLVPIPENRQNWGYVDGVAKWIKAEALEQRFNSVLGTLNYSRIAGLPQLREVDAAKYVEVNVCIKIYDDDGNIVAEKSANGANQLGNGDYKSNLAAAETEAFKQLCTDMGIGAEQQQSKGFVTRKEKIEASKENSSAKGQDTALPADVPSGSVNCRVKLLEQFAKKGSYITASATDDKGREVAVKIFSNKYDELEKVLGYDIETFIARAAVGTELTFVGEYKVYKGALQINLWSLC